MASMKFYNVSDLAHLLDLNCQNGTYHGPCPCCGYKTGFSASKKDGKLLLYCHAGDCIFDDLMRAMGERSDTLPCHPVSSYTSFNDLHFIQNLWSEAKSIKGTIAESYLNSREITDCDISSLRFLPSCRHKPTGNYYPVLIAKATSFDNDAVKAIHRTYLKPDGTGKADIEPNKMTLGKVAGLSIHLAEATHQIAISEGLETGLSVQQETNIPTWVGLSAGGIKALILPPLPRAKDVIIFSDHDSVGLAASRSAAEKWVLEGRDVKIAKPPFQGQDFNDLLVGNKRSLYHATK